METENDILNLADFYGDYVDVNQTISTIATPEPDFNVPYNREINIPETFKNVILKLCPEVIDMKSNGYRETLVYNPETFEPIKKYLVGVDLYFDEKNGMKKSKLEYSIVITDYFKMTYSDLDFVTFHVRSFIFPPEKSNEEKFFEVFGV